jgi:glycosyltransferase involved in cell wall biosynthesis
MQIGIDVRLPYYQMGGISRYTLQLIAALAELDRSNDYTLFHSWKDENDYRPDKANFQRQNLYTPCHHRFERWLLSAELLPRKLDLLHSPDFIPPASGASRHLITVHDLNFLYYPEYLTGESRSYYAGQIEWAVQKADHIAADSEHTRQDLIERLQVPPEKVTTVHLAANPIFKQAFSTEEIDRTLVAFDLAPGYILFVGTLEPRKNVPTLLRAFDLLHRATALEAPLVLVGRKGWLYDEIDEVMVSLGLEEHVRHLPNVGDRQLAHLYQRAGVLALPSHYEGFGFPVLEAMHCGCPVIASNRASLPEVAGDAAILLEPDDVEGWAEAIEQLLAEPAKRTELITAGKRQACRFSWTKTATATLQIYESLL